ncbi:GP179 protein, partial [Chauna torquata]|nr:GP179 protein [Chauna torquata]
CPWESPGTGEPPARPRVGSPTLPTWRKSQSAEVCPWEAQELGSRDKAEICPWEVAAPLSEKGAFSERTGTAPRKASLLPKKLGASKPVEKGSGEREAICPWESPGTEETPPKTGAGKEPS